jgi:hypothetical protein
MKDFDFEKVARATWDHYRRRLFYRTGGAGSCWAWACSEPLNLDHLIAEFGRWAPDKFQIQLLGDHVAIQVFDDVVLVAPAQMTKESWARLHDIQLATQASALGDMRIAYEVITSESYKQTEGADGNPVR